MVSFPKLTIQLIQSFLSSKEAAQTTLVSKSWRKAWLTRTNLDLDQSNHAFLKDFSDYANKTLMRYSLSEKKIHTFSLRMNDHRHNRYYLGHTATSLILRALKLGATRISVEITSPGYVLPDEVFGSESLVDLSLKGCDLNPNQVIRCSSLESLSLDSFSIQDSYVFTRILSSCPLIRSFSLSHYSTGRYYDHSCDSNDDDGFVFGKGQSHDDDVDGYGFDDYDYDYYVGRSHPHGLRSMVLKYVHFDNLFLSDLSTRFTFLKDLTLHMCTEKDRGEILISSPTVERLTLYGSQRSEVKLHVPSIREFTYEGSDVPLLSFISAPRGGWESHMSITHTRNRICTSWFVKLRKFLHKLRRSRISSLVLRLNSRGSIDYEAEAIQGSTPQEIESLTLDFEGMPSLSCYALLDGLFRICRPKLITANNNDFLGRILLDGTCVTISTPSQLMYALNNLIEARAEIFDEALSVWRDVALDAVSTTPGGDVNRKVQFQLNWQKSSTFRDNKSTTNVVKVQRVVRPEKVDFLYGDIVWVVLTRKRYSSGRAGPFQIVRKVYPNAYRLRIPSHAGVPDVINGKHLVPYMSSDEEEVLEDDHVERLALQFIEKHERSKHFR